MSKLKVLIKGLNKVVEFPQDTKMEVIEQSIKGGWNEIEKISGLPMDHASRMERAKYLGFNPDGRFFHGTEDADFEAFDLSNFGQNYGTQGPPSIYATSNPEDALSFGDEIKELHIAAKNHEVLDGRELLRETYNTFDSYQDEPFEDWVASLTTNDIYEVLDLDNLVGSEAAIAAQKGKTGLLVDFSSLDDIGNVALTFAPKNIRSTHAEFDPSQQKSGNLLASASGAAVLGGLAATDDAQAAASSPASANGTQPTNLASYLMANPTRLTQDQAKQIFNQQKIEAPKHPILHDIANLMRKVDTPFGPMFEATPDMLDRWAYGEGTSYFDKVMATLEIAPL